MFGLGRDGCYGGTGGSGGEQTPPPVPDPPVEPEAPELWDHNDECKCVDVCEEDGTLHYSYKESTFIETNEISH